MHWIKTIREKNRNKYKEENMRKKVVILALVLLFVGFGFVYAENKNAQKTGNEILQELVDEEFAKLEKTGAENNIFNIQYLKSFYWSLQSNVYVNVAFKADLEQDVKRIKSEIETKYNQAVARKKEIIAKQNKKIKKEENKIKWEPPKLEEVMPKTFHAFYVRVFKDGKLIQKYKAPIPYDEKPLEFYSFGVILEPGEYELHVVIADAVYKKVAGSKIMKITVPDLTVKALMKKRSKLSTSEPVFYKAVKQLMQENKLFTVDKNCYEIGPMKLIFYPYIGTVAFKGTDKPVLTFYVFGTTPALIRGSNQPQWDVEAKLSVLKDGKAVLKFKPIKMKNPYFFQTLEFLRKDKKPLEPGDYTLKINLLDKNNRKKGEVKIDFKII